MVETSADLELNFVLQISLAGRVVAIGKMVTAKELGTWFKTRNCIGIAKLIKNEKKRAKSTKQKKDAENYNQAKKAKQKYQKQRQKQKQKRKQKTQTKRKLLPLH